MRETYLVSHPNIMKSAVLSASKGMSQDEILTYNISLGFLAEITTLNAELEALVSEIGTVTSESRTLELTVEELEEVLNQLAEEILALQSKIEEYEEEIERLSNNRIAIPAEIARYSPSQLEFMGSFTMTGYCTCPVCCGSYSSQHPSRIGTNYVQRTAGGYIPTLGVTVAVDRSVIPLGTWLYIEGVGVRRAEDTGTGVRGNWVDVYMGTHEAAARVGRSSTNVWIINSP
jgi:3D (Asp-Asp-Asp) domain-containing protein/FtsZ-binding cell division protein ZapB